jgi:hypothetical protein
LASEIPVQTINDNSPKYVYNKHTTYENTMLNIYYSIITNLRNTDTVDALLEI